MDEAYFSAWGTFFWAKWLDHGMLMASGDLAPAGAELRTVELGAENMYVYIYMVHISYIYIHK
jgi:hypothetical protein